MNLKNLTNTKLNKVIILILAIFAGLATGCVREREVRVGVSQNSYDDWREKMNSEMMLEIYQHPGAKIEIRSAENNNERQIKDIEYFIKEKVDVLIVSPREAEALTPIITKAHKAGIKVLVFDREIGNDEYDLYYGADNHLIGRNAGHYIQRFIHPSNNADNPLGIIEIRGLDGSSPAKGRHEGFMEVVGKDPRVKILASVATDWTAEPAAKLADSLLNLYPEAEVIYAHNDRMGVAASQVAKNLGRTDIHVLGVDGAPNIGLKAVADRVLDATFVYPTNGAEVLNDAIGLAKGEEKPRRIIAESAMAIDSSNVELQLLSAHTLDQALGNVKNLSARVSAYAQTRDNLRTLLWSLFALFIMTALVAFLVLRLYWTRKRTQAILAEQNETLRRQRDDLESLNAQLNEATASKLNFFTNVSHDLRTPLTLISSPLETVAGAPELSQRSRGLLEVAVKNVKILQRLINQILDFQKYESGKLDLNLSATDITEAFKEWTAAFVGAARKKDIKLELDLNPDSECMVAVDREKMERVFFNLMSNAFRFTPANGCITVKLDTSLPDEIKFGIKDTGKGIPAENIPHLFERFFQGREGNAGGSGIGLVVVKSFVELHGGTIEVSSEPGNGTLFSVTIPKRSVDAAPAEPHRDMTGLENRTERDITAEIGQVEIPVADEEPEDNGKPTVLVVDDNDDLRVLARTLLEPEYNVLTAPSGESGIRMAMKFVPDCIVSDVMMPGMDGLELTRRLKGESITSHIPIILLTACALDEQRAAGYESGADGYISKPFNEKVLLARIASVIANRKLLKAAPGAEVPVPELPKSAKKTNKAEGAKSSVDPFSELDSTFYRNFVAMVDRDMGDAELSVEEMASRMGMSRVQFYRKLKALTNYSPADLLRLFRLRRAKELLMADDEITVAEVAYKVGYSSPSYFAKCFKDQFGELPSELQGRTSRIQG